MGLLLGLLIVGAVLSHWRGLLVVLGVAILFGLLTGHVRAGGVNLLPNAYRKTELSLGEYLEPSL